MTSFETYSIRLATEEKANKVLHIVIPSIGGTIVVCMVVAIFTAAGYYYKHKDRKGGKMLLLICSLHTSSKDDSKTPCSCTHIPPARMIQRRPVPTYLQQG